MAIVTTEQRVKNYVEIIEQVAKKYKYELTGDPYQDYQNLVKMICKARNFAYEAWIETRLNFHIDLMKAPKQTFMVLYHCLNKDGYTTITVKEIALILLRKEVSVKKHLEYLHRHNFIIRCKPEKKVDPESGKITNYARRIYHNATPPAHIEVMELEDLKEYGKQNIGKIRRSRKTEDLKKRERSHRAPSPNNPPKNLDYLNLSFKRIIPLIKEFNKPINEHEKRLKYFEFFKNNKMDFSEIIYFLPLPVIEQTFHACKNALSNKENPGGYLMTVLKIKYKDFQKKLIDSKKELDMKNDPIYKILIKELSNYLSIKKIEAKYHEIKEKDLNYKKVIQGIIQKHFKILEDKKRLEAQNEQQAITIDFINNVLIPSIKEKLPYVHENTIKVKAAPLYDLPAEQLKETGPEIVQGFIASFSNAGN